jgi:hypothetical protein
MTSGVNQPITQLLDPQTAMRNGSFAQTLSASIDQANLVALARPVDAHKPFNLFRHCSGLPLASSHPGPPQRASIPVLALEAQPPTGLPSRPTCRGAGPLEVLKTQDSWATPGGVRIRGNRGKRSSTMALSAQVLRAVFSSIIIAREDAGLKD